MVMHSLFINEKKKLNRWAWALVTLAIFAGLILSILSWLEVCVEHCAANQDYVLFGLPFAIFGMTFFSALFLLQIASTRWPRISSIVGWMIAAALGAEMLFVAVQKYQIGHWCPVCLSIAASVACAALVLFVHNVIDIKKTFQFHKSGAFMSFIKRALTHLSLIGFGFIVAFIGVSNPNSAEALAANMKERLAFGLKNSPIEVYYATDWYCPSCKKVDPLIEKLYPFIRTKATFFFVDYPIHRKSMNYSPYNLAFLIDNKKQYFKARQMLMELTDKTETPKDEEIERAAEKRGIDFKELSFVDIKNGMDFFDKVVEEYQMKATPTLIFVNVKTHQVIKLEGRDEITQEKVMEALDKIGKS